jgi:hypothetical protein
MKRKNRNIGWLSLGWVLLALLMLSAVWWPENKSAKPLPDQSTRINLALRETGDRLLDLAGDSSTTIAPIDQKTASSWLLHLEHDFAYDSLAPILRRALQRQGIRINYNVSVLRCSDNELMLGYTASTYEPNQEVPCGGRDQAANCLNIELALLEQDRPPSKPGKSLFMLLSGFCLALALGSFLYRQRKTAPMQPEEREEKTDSNALRFGQSSLDPANQTLWVKGRAKNLTFREAKLLHYLLQNANQVLDRERILEAIWQDEGMLVGRSLDVFVSRLRKLLREDECIRIVSIHGVGYRFEVA